MRKNFIILILFTLVGCSSTDKVIVEPALQNNSSLNPKIVYQQANQNNFVKVVSHNNINKQPPKRRSGTGSNARPQLIESNLNQNADAAFKAGKYKEALSLYQRILLKSPTSGEIRYQVGSVFLALKQYQQAIKYLKDAIQFGYEKKEVYHNLSLAYIGLGQSLAGKRILDIAKKSGMKAAEIETALGYFALEDRDLKTAENLFRLATSYDSNYPEAYNGLATIALGKGNLSEAIRNWQKAEAGLAKRKSASKSGFSVDVSSITANSRQLGIIVGPDLRKLAQPLAEANKLIKDGKIREGQEALIALKKQEADNASYWSLRGALAAEIGDINNAKTYLERSILINLNEIEAKINLALIYLNLKEYQKSEQQVESLINISPLDPAIHSLRGDLKAAYDDLSGATASYNEALRLDPSFIPALNNLAILLIEQREIDSAIAMLLRAVTSAEDDLDLRLNLALAYIVASKLPEAEKQLRNIIRAGNDDSIVLFHLGYVVGSKGNVSEAKQLFEKALNKDPHSSLIYNNLGVAAHKQGFKEDAIKYYQRAVKLAPDLAEAYNNLGAAYLAVGKPIKAREAYEKAVRLSNLDRESRRNLGHVLLLEGRAKEAVEQLQLALALSPKDLDTLFNLAIGYRQLGKARESITFFETFIELAANDGSRTEQVIQAERALQKLKYN